MLAKSQDDSGRNIPKTSIQEMQRVGRHIQVSGPELTLIRDVTVRDAWVRLGSDAGSVLIDVRTRAELAFVGVADLSPLGKRLVLVEWQTFPDSRVDPQFVEKLGAQLEVLGATHDTELYFICRSGGRSLSAARAMRAAGYQNCFNVGDGFEGPLDKDRHRGQVAGWKAAGLPWAQG